MLHTLSETPLTVIWWCCGAGPHLAVKKRDFQQFGFVSGAWKYEPRAGLVVVSLRFSVILAVCVCVGKFGRGVEFRASRERSGGGLDLFFFLCEFPVGGDLQELVDIAWYR